MGKHRINEFLTEKSCKELKKVLVDLDWNIADLARNLQTSRQYIDYFLNRKRPISLNWIQKICEAVQTDSWVHQDEVQLFSE